MTERTAEQWIEWCELRLTAEAKYCISRGAPAGAVKAAFTRIKGFGLQLDMDRALAEWLESIAVEDETSLPAPPQEQK